MDSASLVKFLREVNRLKEIERTGWIRDGVKAPESVSDHCFMTALMTLVIGKGREDIDLSKTIKMALVHDIAESRTGDLVLQHSKYRIDNFKDYVSLKEKREKEEKALRELTSMLGKDGREYYDLWNEMMEQKSPESKFVRQIDMLENAVQALIYENKGNFKKDLKDLGHFFRHFSDDIKDPLLKEILEGIISEREKH
jgi:putative hydrolase of HD superfamily